MSTLLHRLAHYFAINRTSMVIFTSRNGWDCSAWVCESCGVVRPGRVLGKWALLVDEECEPWGESTRESWG